MILSGWGRHPKISCSIFRPKNINELKKLIKNKCIPRGNGRSYGDSSLQPDGTIEMKNFLITDNIVTDECTSYNSYDALMPENDVYDFLIKSNVI